MPTHPPADAFADLEFPLRGVDLSQGYGMQQPGTTPTGQNVRVYEALTQRGRGGSRPGLAKQITGQLPNGAHLIQHLNFVVDPNSDATLDNYNYGDLAGEDPDIGIPDPSGQGWFFGGPAPDADGTALLASFFDTAGLIVGGGNLGGLPTAGSSLSGPGGGGLNGGTPGLGTPQGGGSGSSSGGSNFIGRGTTSYQSLQDRNKGRVIRPGGGGVQPTWSRKKTPTITWSDPADINVGTALSSTQLNATASVAGSFAYTPPSGTVLAQGDSQALRTVFTPTDTDKYTTARKTVHINVKSGIRFVQSATGGPGANGTAVAAGLGSGITAGDLLVAAVATEYTNTVDPGIIGSISDSRGNAWSQIGSYLVIDPSAGVQAFRLGLWYAIANASGACTVTIGSGGTSVSLYLEVLNYTGNHASPLDGSSSNTDDTATPPGVWTTGSVSVAGTGELLLGVFASVAVSAAAGTGFTARTLLDFSVGDLTLFVEDKLNVSSATAATAAAAGAVQWGLMAIGASFKPA